VEDYSLAAQTSDLAAVIEATGERRIILFGHCTGGPVTLLYAATHPEAVSHLVLYATFSSGHYMAVSELADALRRLIDADWGGVGSLAMADMFFPAPPPRNVRFMRHINGSVRRRRRPWLKP
jgi:pimeloyl-ACP methyl ester carboxylesterase